MKVLVLSFAIFSSLWQCTPSKSSDPRQKSSASKNTSMGVKVTSGTETSHLSSSSTVVEEDSEPGSNGLDAAALNAMGDSDLQSYYKSRMSQLNDDKQQMGISNDMIVALCGRLQKLRSQCVTANAFIIPQGGVDPDCTSAWKASNTTSTFNVAIKDASGNPLRGSDQYILVANGLYQSTPFGAGPTDITFTYKGGGKVASAEIMQVSNFELRRAEDVVGGTYLTSGKAVALPAIEAMQVQLKYDNIVLAGGPLVLETNANYMKYRYLLNLSIISSNATSSDCTVQQSEIDTMKRTITNAYQSKSNQSAMVSVFSDKVATLPPRPDMITAILDAQEKIAEMAPSLETYMNQITSITTKLQTNQAISCHASEPIVQMSVQITGKVNEPKPLSAAGDGTCPVIGPTGQGSFISLDMGSGVTFNNDVLKEGIGAMWTKSVSEHALVGNIEYLRIGKLGVTIEDLGPKCTSEIMGVRSSCVRQCQEVDTFTITGVKILVDTPSVTSFVIYDNPKLNLVLGSALYSSSAVLSWTENGFRQNKNWLDLMYDTKCSQ